MTRDAAEQFPIARRRVFTTMLGFLALLVASTLGYLFLFETSSSAIVRTAGPVVALIAIPLMAWAVCGYVRGLAVGFAEVDPDGFSYPLTIASRYVQWSGVRDVRIEGEFLLVSMRGGLRRRINTSMLEDPQLFAGRLLEAWRNHPS